MSICFWLAVLAACIIPEQKYAQTGALLAIAFAILVAAERQ